MLLKSIFSAGAAFRKIKTIRTKCCLLFGKGCPEVTKKRTLLGPYALIYGNFTIIFWTVLCPLCFHYNVTKNRFSMTLLA